MLLPQHPLSRLHHLHLQLFGLLPSSLIPVRRRQIGHAGQRVWMLLPQHPQTRLHHLHVQLFGLLPSSLIPVRRRQIGHAGQCVWMLLPQHPQTRLHHLHVQLFGLLPSSLIPVRRRQIAHAGQCVWMLLPQHPLSRLHHLHVQLFGFLPSSLIAVRRRQVVHAEPPFHQVKGTARLFERWGIDFVGILPTTPNGNRWILTAIDAATGWPIARAVQDASDEAVADFLYKEIYCRFGAFRELLSDNGSNLTSRMVDFYLARIKAGVTGVPRGHFYMLWLCAMMR